MAAFDFVWPIRVYYEDTDAGGVVYYANYLKFMERARSEWLRALGFEQDRLIEEEEAIFAVRHVSVDYLKPARFNEQLRVHVKLLKRGPASLYLDQSIRNEAGLEVCKGMVKIACLHARSLRPQPIPQSILTVLDDAS